MNTKEKIAVMQGFVDGRIIELRHRREGGVWGEWISPNIEPEWGWNTQDYRIKPEPRVFYTNEYASNDFGTLHLSLEKAQSAKWAESKIIKVVEVLE
jgi:hypothetical protein